MNGKRILTIWMIVLVLLVAGCASGAGNTASSAVSMETTENQLNADSGAVRDELPTAQGTDGKTDSSVYQNAGAKLIRRAEVSIQTTQFDQAVKSLDELVIAQSGYYESASVYGGGYRDVNARRSGEYVIRVPAEHFLEFQSSMGSLGYVTSTTNTSEDVGQQYYDAEARLKTQRTKQERLLTLLKKAATMEDIISLENALSDTEYEIEQLSSTLNRYDALISYATFHIYLDEVAKITQEVGETATLGQKMSAGFSANVDGLISGVQNLLVWISYHLFGTLIFTTIVAAGAVVGIRGLRTKTGKKKEAGENTQD